MVANTVWLGALPVAPGGDVLETLIVAAVLVVLGANNAVSAAGVHKIFKLDGAGGAVLARPGSRHRAARVGELRINKFMIIRQRLEVDLVYFDAIEDLRTALAGVSEHHIIGLGPNNVPSVAIGATRGHKVGVDCGLLIQLEHGTFLCKG